MRIHVRSTKIMVLIGGACAAILGDTLVVPVAKANASGNQAIA